MKLLIPKDYKSELSIKQTELAIKKVKDFFERDFSIQLNLTRVSAPLYVKNEYDCILTYGIYKSLSVMEINELLFDYGFDTLG